MLQNKATEMLIILTGYLGIQLRDELECTTQRTYLGWYGAVSLDCDERLLTVLVCCRERRSKRKTDGYVSRTYVILILVRVSFSVFPSSVLCSAATGRLGPGRPYLPKTDTSYACAPCK